MNIIDENIIESQRQLLLSWGIHIRQIGHEIFKKGIKDDNIIVSLHQLKQVTFFSRDLGFYERKLCHANYCLVCLDAGKYETASFVQRLLRHSDFNTKTKRMGKVIRVGHMGIRVWQLNTENEEHISWPGKK